MYLVPFLGLHIRCSNTTADRQRNLSEGVRVLGLPRWRSEMQPGNPGDMGLNPGQGRSILHVKKEHTFFPTSYYVTLRKLLVCTSSVK